MSRFERAQKVALAAAVVLGGLGLLAAVGARPLPAAPTSWLWALFGLAAAAGLASGMGAVRRAQEIERRRWEVVEEPGITRGERAYAHKEAERQRRVAGTVFLLGPLLLGFWLAYQVEGDPPPLGAQLLPLVALLGFGGGLLVGRGGGPARGLRGEDGPR